MRLTYKTLTTNSYSQLKRKGFSDNQITNTLSNFYLKENRQLIINERAGLTLSKAIREVKRGVVRQGVWIYKTAKTMVKNDVSNLKKLAKYFGEDSFADNLLTSYQRGELNVYQINKSINSYLGNITEYEAKGLNKNIQVLVDGYA